MIVKYGTDGDAGFFRNVDKTKKDLQNVVLYSVTIGDEIFLEVLSDVLLGDYSVLLLLLISFYVFCQHL
jgi:hypothetical protein